MSAVSMSTPNRQTTITLLGISYNKLMLMASRAQVLALVRRFDSSLQRCLAADA